MDNLCMTGGHDCRPYCVSVTLQMTTQFTACVSIIFLSNNELNVNVNYFLFCFDLLYSILKRKYYFCFMYCFNTRPCCSSFKFLHLHPLSPSGKSQSVSQWTQLTYFLEGDGPVEASGLCSVSQWTTHYPHHFCG